MEFLRELHRPGHGGRATVEFAIDKVGATAEEQPDRGGNNGAVADIQPGDFFTARVDPGEHHNA